MKSQMQDEEYAVIGTLIRSVTRRWAIKTSDGRIYEVTSGEVIEVNVAEHWIRTRIEHNGKDYIAMVDGVKLYQGMDARR